MPISPKTKIETATKPLLIGESNPYGGNPYYALYPYPEGCAGHRLCCRILGMRRKDYLAAFDRVNLCDGPWSIREARARADELADGGLSGGDEEQPLVLFGAKVAAAFGLPFTPFQSYGDDMLVLPHPSGRCRMWGEPGAVRKARAALLEMCPHLKPLVGSYNYTRGRDE